MSHIVVKHVEHIEHPNDPTLNGIMLHFSDHPMHDEGFEDHRHFIPHVALADRAVAYGLDIDDPEFLEDVLEHIIHERISGHEAHKPHGPAMAASFQEHTVDRESLGLARPHAKVDKELARAFALHRTGAWSNVHRWQKNDPQR